MVQIILAARGGITTYFHEDIGRGFLHRGIDQGHGDGQPVDLEIHAPADGLVTFAGPFGSYGNVLFITHSDGWVSVLAHHARQLVSKGDRVTQGQIIAVMGNTGTVYVHNHQELRDAAGNQVDPLLHLGSAPASNGPTTLEEDDMYTDVDRARDTQTHDAVARMELSLWALTSAVNRVEVASGVTNWALTDSVAGLRKMVSGLTGAAAAPIDVAAIAKAVNDNAAARMKD